MVHAKPAPPRATIRFLIVGGMLGCLTTARALHEALHQHWASVDNQEKIEACLIEILAFAATAAGFLGICALCSVLAYLDARAGHVRPFSIVGRPLLSTVLVLLPWGAVTLIYHPFLESVGIALFCAFCPIALIACAILGTASQRVLDRIRSAPIES